MAKVLVGCEFSGKVRDAFIRQGHDAVSCDLLDSSSAGPHIKGDVLDVLTRQSWDLFIGFPPCTHLCSSGARWWKEKGDLQEQAIEFFLELVRRAPAHWVLENPVGRMSSRFRKPDQIIQPYQFGHGEVKKTCLWLGGLPKLIPTDIVEGRYPRIHRMSPSKNRGLLRSITYDGIAEAMASQWSSLI